MDEIGALEHWQVTKNHLRNLWSYHVGFLESLYGSWSAPGDSLEGQGGLQRGGDHL